LIQDRSLIGLKINYEATPVTEFSLGASVTLKANARQEGGQAFASSIWNIAAFVHAFLSTAELLCGQQDVLE
jgi:hypothetical protein